MAGIDFTKMPKRNKTYTGANGNKIAVMYENELFDCGSSLYPQADEKMMKRILSDRNERDHRIYEKPTSAILQNNKKIKYFDFMTSLQYEECNRALQRIVPRIDMGSIKKIIEETPFVSELQKEFYTTMLSARKERILDYALDLISRERMRVSGDFYGEKHGNI